MVGKKLFFFVALISLSLAFLVPEGYNRIYNSICLLVYVAEVLLFLKIKCKSNYFDFDVIFLLIFGVSAFAYPVFFYLQNDPYVYFFNLSFDIQSISKAVSLSLIASTSYMIGGLMCRSSSIITIDKVCKLNSISNRFLHVFIALGITAFIFLGGIGMIQSTYNKNVEASVAGGVLQIMAILQACFMTCIGTEIYNKLCDRSYSFNRILLLEILIFSGIMLYAGNRTYALILLLPFFFYYSHFHKKIKFYQLFLLLPIAFLFMWVIQVSRTGGDVQGQTLEAISVFRDIVIPSRSNYLVYEVVEKEGYSYGESMSGGLIGVVPTLERILKSLVNLDSSRIGSASRFTFYTYGDIGEGVTGLGTMLQADAYLSFGLLGVILIFGYLGFFVNKCYKGFLQHNYFYIVSFVVLIAHSVFLIRAETTYPIKTLVWGLLIAYLNLKWRIKLK